VDTCQLWSDGFSWHSAESGGGEQEGRLGDKSTTCKKTILHHIQLKLTLTTWDHIKSRLQWQLLTIYICISM